MKKIFNLFLLLLLVQGIWAQDYDLYLCIGQSNMAGRGTLTEEVSDTLTDVYLFNARNEFEKAANPLNRYSTIRKDIKMQGVGPAYSFAKTMAAKTGRKIGLVVNARGGSSIHSWKKGAKDGYYEEALLRIRSAMRHGTLKAVLWHQGETDCTQPEQYKEAIKELVTNFRKDLNLPDLFFVAGEIATWAPDEQATERNRIFNDMMRRISDFIPNAACVSSEGLLPLIDQSDPHFCTSSQLILGERYAQEVLKHANGQQPNREHGLDFSQIPARWDEAIPLGNGISGTLIWKKDGNLRLALDRADLWDLRPVKEFSGPDYTYQFICDAVDKGDIQPVYDIIDARTGKDIAPTKIPAGAIEIPVAKLGEVANVHLDVHTAVCTITWKNGVVGRFFNNAVDKRGYFRFSHLPDTLSVHLQSPQFELPEGEKENRNSLSRLGYKNGKIVRKAGEIGYRQKAYGDVSYEVALRWSTPDVQTLEGSYCLTTTGTWYSEPVPAGKAMKAGVKDFATALREHTDWWKNYWEQCKISLPDPVLERQWYLEMYKFGSASRKDAPPICLQAVWTADNGQTPPWRGDFHNDLNTQLSYWPGYASNHLKESEVFTDWLWRIKENSEAFTRQFFGVEGMNVPCIATLEGKNLGGWNQYSHSPTAGGWLAHHFYLQWKYSADKLFLEERAYPWVKEVARYFEHVSVKGKDGKRKLPLSSSPEINDNRIDAWFKETTNYDLACIRFTYKAAAEMAESLGLTEEAEYWQQQLSEWPDFAKDATGLTIAPHYPLPYTHRHLSNMLAIHPLGLLDVSQGKEAERLIKRSIHHFEEVGVGGWVGYTYTWLANLHARVFDGDAAARALHIFAKAFCSPNSFHLNGDQLKKGYSGFTYRPFTLEGNFAFASAIQEMLLQSHTGIINVFPAIPESWQNASFRNMRAMGAFIVSADYKKGKVSKIVVRSEKGGKLKIFNPFTNKVEEKEMKAGETIALG